MRRLYTPFIVERVERFSVPTVPSPSTSSAFKATFNISFTLVQHREKKISSAFFFLHDIFTGVWKKWVIKLVNIYLNVLTYCVRGGIGYQNGVFVSRRFFPWWMTGILVWSSLKHYLAIFDGGLIS